MNLEFDSNNPLWQVDYELISALVEGHNCVEDLDLPIPQLSWYCCMDLADVL